MRRGIYLPQIGPEAGQTRVVETAQAAETAGIASLWAMDHVVLREEYGTPYPYAASGASLSVRRRTFRSLFLTPLLS
jgi:alkanesulfonate monooxygenase SsuD/methylene tetrahydromethanopterin reductase-like flavin-dependent oxidoreductase (luciferase family)